jgi:cytosine/uracil/thiamine/allantoin permease
VGTALSTGQKSFALWTCMAANAVMYSVPVDWVRWNLSTIAPLVWWQLAMSTALGTIFALPFLLAVANPAVNYRLIFPILARVSFGVRGRGLKMLPATSSNAF